MTDEISDHTTHYAQYFDVFMLILGWVKLSKGLKCPTGIPSCRGLPLKLEI